MSPRAHGLGVASAACGLLLCILPVLAWYSADLPTGSDSLTGYGASAATWVLPVAGVILIAEPEKALADYLYFVDLKLKTLNERLYLKRKINGKTVMRYVKLFERKSLIDLAKGIL